MSLQVQWAENSSLRGVFIWHIASDDLQGYCGPKFPLLNAVSEALGRPNIIPILPPVVKPVATPISPTVASASMNIGVSQVLLALMACLVSTLTF